ncbi:MAG: hypothetical protein MUQ32_06725 [Chloroflexi bacterium]|nr:hypothetical protein [Chloroflexota bacterium]
MGPLELWQWAGIFLVAGGVVVVAGTTLARSGDQIATRTGLGGFLVGMLLLAGATSLPEAATGISASLDGAPDLAVGGVFGSSMANMAILAIIDLLNRGRVWPRIGLSHARLTAVAIGLTSVAVLAILVPPGIAIGWVGLDTVFIVATYVAAAAWMSRAGSEGERTRESSGEILAPTGWSERGHATACASKVPVSVWRRS